MRNALNRTALAAALLSAGLFLAGCGDGYEGDTYTDSEGGVTVEFRSGNRAYIDLGGIATSEVGYEVDGDRVILETPDGNSVLTRRDDGSLDGGMMLGTLKKKE